MATSMGSYLVLDHVSNFHSIASFTGTFIGGLTLTGSIAAFIKLANLFKGQSLNLPMNHLINKPLAALSVGSLTMMINSPSPTVGFTMLGITAMSSCALGWNITFNIGAADMPVAITVLNSYSGWALCAEGFMLNNTLLTIVGSLVGSSGAILTYIMCEAMNRNIYNVIFGTMGSAGTGKS